MEHSTIIILTAFSGLAGALLTQLMTGLFSYINDRRKQTAELTGQFRNKKVEIGESFYFINGELMTMIRKNIAYWKNLHNGRSEASRSFMHKEMEKLDAYQAKLNAENWKYNLIGIYFDVPFTFNEMLDANRRSHELYLKITDLSEKIKSAATPEAEELYKFYNVSIFVLIMKAPILEWKIIWWRSKGNC
ncbi:MAG: hypothetical protein JWP78_1971 [Mucilaginibacter sp.]|nr:hypothetical protein [Mucilaginibacter sp.]